MTHKSVIPTPPDEPETLVRAMKGALEETTIDVRGASVGVPGLVAYATGEVISLNNLNGWEPHASARHLAAEIGLPVLVANDADLAALGEHRFGAGRDVSDMLYMTCSTGVGGGVIIGGRLLCGHWSLAEGGHTVIERGTGGTVETLGSGPALERLAGAGGAEVAARARAGDEIARAQFREVADAFATGVYNLVQCFSPERVVIGGGMSRAGDLLLDPIRERLDRSRVVCSVSGADVVVAEAGDDVGLYGAFALWMDSMTGGASGSRLEPAEPA